MNNNQEINTKICSSCKEEKQFTEFHKQKSGKYGIQPKCKVCKLQYGKANECITPYPDTNTKVCKCCKLEKKFSEFHKHKSRKYGVGDSCKPCSNHIKMEYYNNNKGVIKKSHKKYIKNNKSTIANYHKEYYENNKKEILNKHKDYRNSHKHKRNEHDKTRRKYDINYNLLCKLRGRLNSILKSQGIYKSKKSLELLGCSIPEFKLHIESQFKEGMTWNNHSPKGWHIDHIIPCSSFDMIDIKQQQECFHYTNMQPLWWYENLSKGSIC